MGGQIHAGGQVRVNAGSRVVNEGGSMFGVGDVILESPEIIARGRSYHTVLYRDGGLKAMLGDTWAKVYANDQGGGFSSQQGKLILRGTAIQDRGWFAGGAGIEGDIQVIEMPRREPVRIEEHLGLFFW